jgi:HEAT repeat protein
MRISVFSGASCVVWQLVCSIQPLFNVFFQNYMGASAGQLGLLVTIIQASAAFQIVGIILYGLIGRQKPIFLVGHVIHRALTAIIAFVAFYAARGGSTERGVVIIIVAMGLSWVFANATSACWWGWVADIFPESMRGAFFMRRSAIIQVVNIAWFFLASTLLDVFPKESSMTVFGVIISVGAVAGILDIVSQIVTPEPLPDRKSEFRLETVLEPLRNPDFVRYAVAIGLAVFSMNMIGPFQAPYVVNPERIGAPNTWLGIMSMLSQFIWVLVAPFWGTIMDRWGKKPVVTAGTLLVLGWIGYLALTPGNFVIVLPLIAVSTGLLSPAFWDGSYQMMLSLSPEKNRVSYIAWYLAIMGLVSAPGSLAGGLLSDALRGFSLPLGPVTMTNFHVVQAISIALCCLCAILVSRVREGSEKPFGYVIAQLANPSIIRTFQSLDSLGKAPSPDRNERILRGIDGRSAALALRDVIEMLDDPDSNVREEAARTLGRIAPRKTGSPAQDALILRLLDANSDIRIPAARALGKIGDRKAVPALIGCLHEGGEELQRACLEALADIGDESSIEHVMTFLRESRTDRMKQAGSKAAARLGAFEAAWEIYPALLKTPSRTARRQYAIALANVLGQPNGFYEYVSGHASVLEGRQKKLIARFTANLKEVYARARVPLNADLHSAIKDALSEDKNEDALRACVALVDRLFADLFGDEMGRDALYRIDQKLGILSWMIEEAETYLAHPPEGVPPEGVGETSRLLALLIVYFLASY